MGVEIVEVPTGVKPPVRVTAGLPVYVGTAPIGAGDLTKVNKAVLCNTLAEFVTAFGPLSDDFASWTLHEAAKAHFSVYGVAPIVCVCVSDPENEDHIASETGESHQLVDGEVQLQAYGGPDAPLLGIIKSSVVVKEGVTTRTLGTDYTLAFDDDGYLVVSIVEGGALGESDIILVDFDYLDPTAITADDIIGGYSGGQYTGLEVIEQVFPSVRLVPGFLSALKWNETPEVAARLAAMAALVNGNFKALALTDLSSDPNEIETYADAAAWKADNGYTSKHQIALWPKGKNGDDVYCASTLYACAANLADAARDGIPYKSPSNELVTIQSAVQSDGTEVLLTGLQVEQLNAQGIVTLANGFNGWRLKGNRTGAYPSNTDPKDAFAPIRRMFNWIGNTAVLTTDANVDDPINRRLIDLVLGTMGSFLNGLIAVGALVDGRIEFREDENAVADLSDGRIKWHMTLTPPSPGDPLIYVLEYDPAGLANLFAA